MTEQLRQELDALREVARKKADDTRRLADELEAVITAIVGRPPHESPRRTMRAGDRHEGHDSSAPLAHSLHPPGGVEREDSNAQRETLERLQSEMREHVADAAALADRIAALQLRIDIALAQLTTPPGVG
jgi:hypothetical protein